MKVKLFTREGVFVRDGEIPPFFPIPEVLTWGSRTFISNDEFTMADADTFGYVERMCYSLEAADAYVGGVGETEAKF